ncbi:hypothetical protein NE850_15780 [Paraburkholderia sp. USG1]|uniref:hypothetical protein n=1 Tax=Paraburkholderia sp. USG1 TaxID=2952268 RepID=UPI00285D6F5A|nr:hypothetical protein [Paraburkholderia sp. USG1]MDR8397806.1 hypothetical protein [Paraburkholderia sp. USG1]
MFGFIVQRIEHGEKTLAGHAENTFDTVRQQSIDDETRAGGLSGGGTGNRNGSIRLRHCDEASRQCMSAM